MSDVLMAKVVTHLRASAEIKLKTAEHCSADVVAGARLIAESFGQGGKLLLCGNGGSAADCQHLAAEFVSRLTQDFDRPALPALALTTDSSFLTAYANDVNYEGIFERQVQALGKPCDVLIGISTSGNSANVLAAVKAAHRIGMKTIALTGSSGQLAKIADVAISIPSQNTQYIQESHLAAEHLLCALVEILIYGER